MARLSFKYKLLNKDRKVTATVDGIVYELDMSQEIDSSIYYKGCFEPQTTDLIEKYVKCGMTVLDIGANIGAHTLRFAKLVGQNGKVIAFEPTLWARTKLMHNIELNDFKNIFIENLGLSDVNTIESVSLRSSYPLKSDLVTIEEKIEFISLDEYVKLHNIKKIDFIKIDTDGYEYKIIQGALNTLAGDKPPIIIELSRSEGNNVADILRHMGYKFYSEQESELVSPVDSIPINSNYINVFCLPSN